VRRVQTLEPLAKLKLLWFTPKALANSSPGLQQPWESAISMTIGETLKEFAKRALANAFSVQGAIACIDPRVAATLGWNWPTPSA